MKSVHTEIFSVQRKIAFIASAAGMLVTVINYFNYLPVWGPYKAFFRPAVHTILLITVLTVMTGLKDRSFLRILQISLAFIMGALSILDAYNSIHGLGMVVISILLTFKYGLLKTNAIPKLGVFMAAVFLLVMVSVTIAGKPHRLMYAVESIIYLIAFLSVSYLIYQDEISSFIKKAHLAEDRIARLKIERRELADRLRELDSRIAELTQPVDLEQMGITRKERKVLETLIIYRETEQDLAARLGISYYTLKNHFRHIRDKLGVDRREDLIEMCRNNFIETG